MHAECVIVHPLSASRLSRRVRPQTGARSCFTRTLISSLSVRTRRRPSGSQIAAAAPSSALTPSSRVEIFVYVVKSTSSFGDVAFVGHAVEWESKKRGVKGKGGFPTHWPPPFSLVCREIHCRWSRQWNVSNSASNTADIVGTAWWATQVGHGR